MQCTRRVLVQLSMVGTAAAVAFDSASARAARKLTATVSAEVVATSNQKSVTAWTKFHPGNIAEIRDNRSKLVSPPIVAKGVVGVTAVGVNKGKHAAISIHIGRDKASVAQVATANQLPISAGDTIELDISEEQKKRLSKLVFDPGSDTLDVKFTATTDAAPTNFSAKISFQFTFTTHA